MVRPCSSPSSCQIQTTNFSYSPTDPYLFRNLIHSHPQLLAIYNLHKAYIYLHATTVHNFPPPILVIECEGSMQGYRSFTISLQLCKQKRGCHSTRHPMKSPFPWPPLSFSSTSKGCFSSKREQKKFQMLQHLDSRFLSSREAIMKF